jgi:hypothetical protein
MSFEVKLGKVWLYGGASWKRFALGFEINTSWVTVDIGPFYVAIEYWNAFRRKDG